MGTAMLPSNDSVMALGRAMGLGNQYNDILHRYLTNGGYYGSLNDQLRAAGAFTKPLVDVGNIFTGIDGGWYDPILPTLWDTSTGVAQVDAAEDPVGLWADRRLGMVLGPEKITLAADREFSSDTGYWTKGAGWTISGGVANANITTGQLTANAGLAASKTYQITVTVTRTSGTLRVNVGGFTPVDFTTSGTHTFRANTGASGTPTLFFLAVTSFVGTIDNISVKLLDGNHLIQATAPARLTYRVDAGGLPYVALLGTDDNVTSPTGGGGSAGFALVAAINPAGGAGTLRTLWSDTGTNTGRKVQIDASNKLSFSAGNGAAFTTLASTATLDVGTPYVITVRDNGTTLSVQINTAAAETVARPVVSAGTTSFTVGKDNGAASSYIIANAYHLFYVNNSGLTDSQIASEQAYARSKIGL